MSRFPFLAMMLSLAGAHACAQVFPAEGSTVNYCIVGFEAPTHGHAARKLEIAADSIADARTFSSHIVTTVTFSGARVVARVPAFGRAYTWRVTGDRGHEELHHFRTGQVRETDTSLFRLCVVRKAKKFQDAFVFVESNQVLYDMAGNPVWYLPAHKEYENAIHSLRDLKMTPQGTITFLVDGCAYEVDWNGNILWQSPNTHDARKRGRENIHHEFTRLANGHYMLMSEETRRWHADNTGALTWAAGLAGDRQSLQATTIIEYDTAGREVWKWESAPYYESSGLYDDNTPEEGNEAYTTHGNAFCFDEKHKFVYVSFRNTSQLLKVKYPEGNVVAAYGQLEKLHPQRGRQLYGNQREDNGRLFCAQHACSLSGDEKLLLYNNNLCSMGGLPSIEELAEPQQGQTGLTKLWEYTYPAQVAGTGARIGTTGGNVKDLPGGCFFASQCSPFANIFIVSHDKQLLWDAVFESRGSVASKWEEHPQYRASIVPGKKALEALVWGSRSTH